jgi:hypothetical protein
MILKAVDYTPDLPEYNDDGGSVNLVNVYPRTKESYGPINALSPYAGKAHVWEP